jgi:hypothetical protein
VVEKAAGAQLPRNSAGVYQTDWDRYDSVDQHRFCSYEDCCSSSGTMPVKLPTHPFRAASPSKNIDIAALYI